MKFGRKKKASALCAGVLCAGLIFTGAGCSEVKIGGENNFAQGETTLIENPTKSVEEYSAKENAYILAGRLKTLTSYRTEVTGKVVAGFFNYTQIIADVHIKNGDESFSQAKSTSAFVNVGKQAFFKGDRVVMRDAEDIKKDKWKDSFSVTTLDEYRAKIGCEPTSLSNYILNDETIVTAEFVSFENGLYTYRYEIDPAAGTSRYAIKMKEYGGLNSLPVFESCTLSLTFDADWNPVSLFAEDKYKADKISFIGDMACTSTLTETFYDIGKDVEIPDAEFFRNQLGEEPGVIGPEEADKWPTLADSLLNMDLSGGVSIRGELSVSAGSGELISVPLDAWLSFDVNKMAEEGLSAAFRGRAKIWLPGIGAEIFYPGDGYLYVNLGGIKYRYPLAASEEGLQADDFFDLFTVEQHEENGNTYVYKLEPDSQIFRPVNTAIGAAAAKLPEALSWLKDFSLKEISALVSVHKTANDPGRITAVTLSADFGIAALGADVTVAERAEKLPSAEELAAYKDGNGIKLAENLGTLSEIFGGVSDLGWTEGRKLTLTLGLDSEALGPIMLFEIPVEFQILPEAFLSGDVLGSFRFRACIDLFVISVNIYYENGVLYIVNMTAEGENAYATSVTSVDVADALIGAAKDSLFGNGMFLSDGDGGEGIFAALADFILNFEVTTSRNEDGSTRVTVAAGEAATAALSVGYNSVIDRLASIDFGDELLNMFIPAILESFKLDADCARLEADFTDGELNSVFFRLIELNSETLWDAYWEEGDLGFVVGLTFGENLPEGGADEMFETLHGYIAAAEEGAPVSAMIAELSARGVRCLGDAYAEELAEVQAAYEALSEAARYTVSNYDDLAALRTEFDSLRAPVDELLGYMELLKTEEGATAENFAAATALYDGLYDDRQFGYLGKYAETDYLARRIAYEEAEIVPGLIEFIGRLDAEHYPQEEDLAAAVREARRIYDGLHEISRQAVTNAEKLAENNPEA